MSLAFVPRLVNGPFGDPGLYVALRFEGRALLFDLGHNDALPTAEVLRVSHVFVSHCHMDHFIGFDHLLRVFLARDKRVCLFGPPGVVDCVAGKLRGYTWNLVDDYQFAIEVGEVAPDEIRRVLFRAAAGFTPEELPASPFTGTLIDEPAFQVRAVHLDHRIYSLGFAVEEKTHLNVDAEALHRLEVAAGPWLTELKRAVRRNDTDDSIITARWREKGQQEEQTRKFRLGVLRGQLLEETRGQKLAYVVDTLYSPANAARVADLARDADVFFCESPFLHEDIDQATRRYHLTACQAGWLGRAANAKRLVVFHFSPRYAGQAERITREAQDAFLGTEDRGEVSVAPAG